MRRSLPLLLILAAMAALPSAASASSTLLSTMMDDDLLVYRDDATRDLTLKRMKDLGVDYVRVTVLWSTVAEYAKRDKKGRKRRKFKADNPRTYPRRVWDRYDRLVRTAKRLGIGVYFNVTGPGPKWAHKKPPRSQRANRRTWMPKKREFFKFVKAVGRRFDGTYKDENDGRPTIPKVSFWSIYNEPNQAGWLTPQWRKKIAWAPVMYRELWYYGRAALDATGHGDDIVLIGETAPLGNTKRDARGHLHPRRFIREFFCIDDSGKRYTGSAARRRKCGRLTKTKGGLASNIRSLAWAHHPYTKNVIPTQRDAHPDSITMANTGDLAAALNQAQATAGVQAPDFSIMTEFGFETDPPDPIYGISPARQAEYINLGEYLAYSDPTVLGQAQFLYKDVEPNKAKKKNTKSYWFTYQSGLFNANGTPKPSATAYAMPLVMTGKGVGSVGETTVRFWGGVRFLPFGTQTSVSMQYRPRGGASFSTVGDPVPLEPGGYFNADISQPGPGTWRAVWVNPVNGSTLVSRQIEVN